MGVLGDFGPINVIIHHRDPQKAYPCVNLRSFKQSTVKIKSASLNDRPTVDILFNIRKINVNNCDQSLY